MRRNSAAGISALMLAIAGTGFSQDPPASTVRTRNLWNEAFTSQRANATGAPEAAVTASPAVPKPVVRPKPAAAELGDGFVGLTVWKMKKAAGAEPVKMRGLTYPGDPRGTVEWSPERTTLEDPVKQDQYVRLSIESARKGYLYVIDRDRYADGSAGPPELIFPTSQLRRGDNRVEPGLPVEIPSAGDEHPAFLVQRTRPDQVAIEMVIIVAPAPIPDLTVQAGRQVLSDEQVRRWEKLWGSKVERLDSPTDRGKLYTAEEHSAAKHGKPLGPQDPVPATLFHCRPKTGDPMLVQTSLRVIE